MTWDAPITPRQLFERLVDAEKELVKLRALVNENEKLRRATAARVDDLTLRLR